MTLAIIRRRRWYLIEEILTMRRFEEAAFGLKLSWMAIFRILFKNAPITYVAYDQNKMAAYAICDLDADKETLWVQSFVVLPEYRRRKVGVEIIKTAENERGIKAIKGLVRVDNQIARSLYGKMGYHEVGIQKKHYPDGSDAIIVTKDLASTTWLGNKDAS